MMGEPDEDELGLGQHYLATRDLPAYSIFIDEATMRRWTREIVPYMAADTPGGIESLREMGAERRREALADLAERRPPPL